MPDRLQQAAIEHLEAYKAENILVLDVSKMTSMTDTMIIACGRSQKHVQAIAQNIRTDLKNQGYSLVGSEGTDEGEWALVDFGALIIHIMLPSTREFYNLEKLWSKPPNVNQEP